MVVLKGNKCCLRALEAKDLDFLYHIENDEKVWQVSETLTPYSKFILKQYLENSHRDIYDIKQLRLAIVLKDTEELIGFIDVFDFNPKNKRAGIGIIIAENYRGKGLGHESLQIISTYCFKYLNVHQLYANIAEDNKMSIALFEKNGFQLAGIKKDWVYSNGKYTDELLFQKIKK